MKRTIKQNRYGNWNGYEGGRKAVEFGLHEGDAQAWLADGTLPHAPSDAELAQVLSKAAAVPAPPELTTVPALLLELAEQGPALGWTAEVGAGFISCWGEVIDEGSRPGQGWIRFSREEGDVKAVIALNLEAPDPGSRWDVERAYRGVTVEGHTLYNGRTFTRIGIDVSSCGLTSNEHLYSNQYADLPALLSGEFERCQKAAERSRTAEPLPGLPFSRQPEWFLKAGVDLRAGRRVTLAPHGMGTGYILTTRSSRFSRPADPALRARLGVAALYVETYDHD